MVETKVTFLVLPRERLQDSVIRERGGKNPRQLLPRNKLLNHAQTREILIYGLT